MTNLSVFVRDNLHSEDPKMATLAQAVDDLMTRHASAANLVNHTYRGNTFYPFIGGVGVAYANAALWVWSPIFGEIVFAIIAIALFGCWRATRKKEISSQATDT